MLAPRTQSKRPLQLLPGSTSASATALSAGGPSPSPHDRPLTVVADEVVARRLRFSDPPAP